MNYIWTFEEYDFSDGYFDDVKIRKTANNSIPLLQINDNGETVNFYSSKTEALQVIHGDFVRLTKAIENETKYKNYYWKINK